MVRQKSSSFQNEIPPSRVNIRYVKDIGGAQEKVELPLKLLLLGDYTMRGDDTLLEERKRISVNKNNIDSVLEEQKISLSMLVPNRLSGEDDRDQLQVDLKIESFKDFHPDRLVEKIPELKDMIELRNLLTDLKARVITNRKFRQELDKFLASDKRDDARLAALREQLDQIAPLPDAVRSGESTPDDDAAKDD